MASSHDSSLIDFFKPLKKDYAHEFTTSGVGVAVEAEVDASKSMRIMRYLNVMQFFNSVKFDHDPVNHAAVAEDTSAETAGTLIDSSGITCCGIGPRWTWGKYLVILTIITVIAVGAGAFTGASIAVNKATTVKSQGVAVAHSATAVISGVDMSSVTSSIFPMPITPGPKVIEIATSVTCVVACYTLLPSSAAALSFNLTSLAKGNITDITRARRQDMASALMMKSVDAASSLTMATSHTVGDAIGTSASTSTPTAASGGPDTLNMAQFSTELSPVGVRPILTGTVTVTVFHPAPTSPNAVSSTALLSFSSSDTITNVESSSSSSSSSPTFSITASSTTTTPTSLPSASQATSSTPTTNPADPLCWSPTIESAVPCPELSLGGGQSHLDIILIGLSAILAIVGGFII